MTYISVLLRSTKKSDIVIPNLETIIKEKPEYKK